MHPEQVAQGHPFIEDVPAHRRGKQSQVDANGAKLHGLLRAIGLTRRQTRTMIRWEAVLIAFLGLVLGAGLGLALGVAAVRALASAGITHVAIPFVSLAFYAVATLLIGLGAAILPARRAARLNVLDAISSE